LLDTFIALNLQNNSKKNAGVTVANEHKLTSDQGARRRFLKTALAGSALAVTGFPHIANAALTGARELKFNNLHTGERLRTVYWEDGSYVPTALSEIDYILRDWRTEDMISMDRGLLDLLSALRRELGTTSEFEVISGYRSPKTNAMLASKSNGVAKKSLHMQGLAIDIKLPDRSLIDIRNAAWKLQRGGVGYYQGQFVHVDTGRVRRWNWG
jgi:uncharacterized protein YcbK (DUF882 family)